MHENIDSFFTLLLDYIIFIISRFYQHKYIFIYVLVFTTFWFCQLIYKTVVVVSHSTSL